MEHSAYYADGKEEIIKRHKSLLGVWRMGMFASDVSFRDSV